MTKIEALKIFNTELGDGGYCSLFSNLENVPDFHRNPFIFKHNVKIAFKLDVPEENIPINKFSCVGDLLNWVIEVVEGRNFADINSNHISAGREQLNMIITGRSGAGKSSFLNYLIGKDHFKTGDGAPITSLYFDDYLYTSPETGATYRLLDTKGIEPNTTRECRLKVIEKIRQSDRNSDIFNWIHTVYYCFDASAKRIQPFEIEFIKDLLKEAAVIILLTKKDLVADSVLKDLIAQINKEIGTSVQIISVCSVEKLTRKGIAAVCSGREEVLKASFLGLWTKISQVYPLKLLGFLTEPSFTVKMNLPGVLDFCKYCEGDSGKNMYMYKLTQTQTQTQIESMKKLATANLSLDYLCNYPNLSDLHCQELGSKERKDIENLMASTAQYMDELRRLLALLNVDKLWDKNIKLHERVFSFYRNLNKEELHVFHSHQSKDALDKLKKCNLHERVSNLNHLSSKVRAYFVEIANCFIWDDDEKKQAVGAYNSYQSEIRQIANDLKSLVNQFVVAYQSELYQYGQCCIRKDAEVVQQGPICSESDLNANEKIYYNTLLLSLKDCRISDNERSVLDNLRVSLNVLPIRAGLIEDYIRNK